MKEIWMVSIGLFLCGTVVGQTFSEWFAQKKTQIKYLKEQIVALKAYQMILEDGYKLAKQELDGIGSEKQADLDQHSSYIGSLKTAKGAIKDDPRIRAAFDLSNRTIDVANTVQKLVRSADNPSFEMLSFADFMVGETTKANEDVEDMLGEIVYGRGFAFTDDQRLGLLDHLYKGTQLNYRNAISAMRKINELLNQPAQ